MFIEIGKKALYKKNNTIYSFCKNSVELKNVADEITFTFEQGF